MKYAILSFRSMRAKLYVVIFVLILSFFMLLLFYGETVRNHHFVLSTMYFSAPKMGGEVMSFNQWEDICKTFNLYKEKMEGSVYVSIALYSEEEDIYSSLYYFKEKNGEKGKNSFTEEEYKSCAKIIRTSKKAERIQIGSTWLTVQHWDSLYSEIPITTVANEQLPIQNISIVCGCMSGNDYKKLGNKLQEILSPYNCTVDQIDQVLEMEQQKTWLFLAAVLVSVLNIALIYQYIMQEQRYHVIIYRLCGCQRSKLYFISLIEIMVLFVVSFAAAAAGYSFFYSAMYQIGVVSLQSAMGISYIVTAGTMCGIATIVLFLFCSAGIIRRPVKELYVEGE